MSGARGAGVWLLAIGQTLTYAGAYYVFAALLPDLIAATGWSEAQLAAGPTLGFLLCAGLMPVTGRLVDRGLSGVMLVALPVVAGWRWRDWRLCAIRWHGWRCGRSSAWRRRACCMRPAFPI